MKHGQYSTNSLPWEAPQGPQAGSTDFSAFTSFTQCGASLRVHTPMCGAPPAGGGRRGVVRQMSDASRLRLSHKFAAVKPESVASGGTLVSLTFAKEFYSDDGFIMKRHREMFFRRFDRAFGNRAFFWRWERGKKGGRLHLHMLVFGVQWDRETKPERLVKAWGVGFVDCKPIDGNRVFCYLSKYCAKGSWDVLPTSQSGAGDPVPGRLRVSGGGVGAGAGAPDLNTAHNVSEAAYTFPGLGRWWGIRHLETLGLASPETFAVIPGQIQRQGTADVRRFLRRLAKAAKRSWGGPEWWVSGHIGSWFHARKQIRRDCEEAKAAIRSGPSSEKQKQAFYRRCDAAAKAALRKASPARCDWLRVSDYASFSALLPSHNVSVEAVLQNSLEWRLMCLESGNVGRGGDAEYFNVRARGRACA